jgi:ribonuclease H
MYIYETADEMEYELLKNNAIHNRQYATEAERLLWHYLKEKKIGYKFRRQHIVGEYITDFINLKHKLIIEIDGKYHQEAEQVIKDTQRTQYLEQKGYTVIRFTNEEVFNHMEDVINKIKGTIMAIDSHNTPPIAGSQINTSPSPQTSNQSDIKLNPQLQQTGASHLSGGLRGAGAWAVDAACSGNPGPMEYQCVDLQTGAQIFHFGPVQGTNNIGEFLAIVHALALMEKQGIKDKVIYSDSYNAILWVKKKKCKTTLTRNSATEQLYQIIARAEQWLMTHNVTTPIIKWETKQWGEIPADFGRKK